MKDSTKYRRLNLFVSEKAVFAVLLFLVFSFFFFRAGMTLSIVALAVLAIVRVITSDNKCQAKSFFRHPIYFPLMLLFAVPVITGFWSDDGDYMQDILRIRLPFLILPPVFYVIPSLKKKRIRDLLLVGSILGILSVIPILIEFFRDRAAILEGLSQGVPMKVPMHHVHYSSALAFFAVMNGYEAWNSHHNRQKIHLSIGLILGALVLFLAVRTGIALMLVGVLLLTLYKWRENSINRKTLWGIVGLAMVLIVGSIFLFPSLKNRLTYTLEDISSLDETNNLGYSDGLRWASNQIANDIYKDYPYFGIGHGDMAYEMELGFFEKYAQYPGVFPHNQYLYEAVCSGLLGLLIFMGIFFRGFAWDWRLRSFGHLLCWLFIFLAMMTDLPLNQQHSLMIFLIPILLGRPSNS